MNQANSESSESEVDQKTKEREEEEVHQKAAAGPHIVYRAVLEEGEEELGRPTSALAWSGLAAGLSMGFSLVAEGLLRSHLPDAPWRPLIAKLGYCMGFVVVVLGRQQLFTENTLTPILPLLHHKDLKTLRNVGRMWVVVLTMNLLGAGLFALAVQRTTAFDDNVRQAFAQMGREAMDHPFNTLVIRGIFAGWLIALMVWLLPVAETARVGVIIIVTYVVGLGHMAHIIAGSVEALYAVAAHERSFGNYLSGYMLPTLIGNIIGGVSLVAALNHAQVVAGKNSATPGSSD